VKTSLPLLAAMVAVSLPVLAQERTAGTTLDTQMTWSALNTRVESASNKANAVNTRVDQVAVCGGKGLVYAPGSAGADAQGCKQATTDPAVTTAITNLQNSVNALSSSVTSANTTIGTVLTCSKQGQFFNGTTCVSPATGTVQAGSLTDASSFTPRSFAITFPKPFTSTPRVYLALDRYRYHDNCREDQFTTEMSAGNVTTHGFTLTLGGSVRCGGEERVEKVTWIAVQP